MSKSTKPVWRRILEDYALGPEPEDTGSIIQFGEMRHLDLHRNWVELRDAKLLALALREQATTPAGDVDWRALALSLATKHETGFKSQRKRGRPGELRGEEATAARRALLNYVTTEAKQKPVGGQSTRILTELSRHKNKLATIHPYYKNAGRQSLSKLKKDYQKGKQEADEYTKHLAAALMSPPVNHHIASAQKGNPQYRGLLAGYIPPSEQPESSDK